MVLFDVLLTVVQCCTQMCRLQCVYLVFVMTIWWINPLESRGNYSATLNNRKLAHWPLMGGLLHLVQRGGNWVGLQPAHPCCTKCNSPPINGQCASHRIAA